MSEPTNGGMSEPLDEVVAWIRSRHPSVEEIAPDDDLIENRLVDSLGFVEFIILIERLSGRPLAVDTINLDDFRSLSRLEQAFFAAPAT